MVGLVADNAKLRRRAAGTVADISGASVEAADAALSAMGGDVKAAILVAVGALAAEAKSLLTEAQEFSVRRIGAMGRKWPGKVRQVITATGSER